MCVFAQACVHMCVEDVEGCSGRDGLRATGAGDSG